MRGLKKTAPDGAQPPTDGHGDSMTESAQLGRFSENILLIYSNYFDYFLLKYEIIL